MDPVFTHSNGISLQEAASPLRSSFLNGDLSALEKKSINSAVEAFKKGGHLIKAENKILTS